MQKTAEKIVLFVALAIGVHTLGCSKSWQMDYGTPAAQFLSVDLAAQGEPFVGKKITVQGTVTKIDTSDPHSAWIYLDNGVRCNLGKFRSMAAESSVGDTVSVDGFLMRCEDGDVLLEPAMLRDPTAPFSPE